MIELLKFDEPDPERQAKEAVVHRLTEEELRSLYNRTRAAAQRARAARQMEELYALVRGTKTIQRIAGERGILIMSRRLHAD